MRHFAKFTIGVILTTLIIFLTGTEPTQVTQAQSSVIQLPDIQASDRTIPAGNQYWWWSLLHAADDGNWEIYLWRYDQLHKPEAIRLTNHPAVDMDAQWNNTTDRIVFVSDRDTVVVDIPNTEIYVMEPDGSNQRRLTNNPLRDEMPAWSPDGQRIAFSSEHDDGMEIYTMNADGSGRVRFTTQAGNDWYPTWSPDGKTIAWMRQGVNTGEIWLMNADGSNQRQLLGPTRFLNRPRWSPDGRYLAFSYFPRTKELGRIGIIQSDGANFHELACDTAAPNENHVVGAWAPDGSALYYTRYFLNFSFR